MLKLLIQIKIFLLALFVSAQCALAQEVPKIDTGVKGIEAESLATKIVNIGIGIGALAGAVCVVMMVYAGYKFVTAVGERERADAKELLKNIIIGLAIIGFATLIIGFVANLIQKNIGS